MFTSKHYSFFRFLKFLLIFARMGSNFSKVSHLNVIPVAHRGSKLSKKHSIHSWSVYAVSIFGKNFIWLNGVHFIKWAIFPDFQCSQSSNISSLYLKIELHLSLL